MTSVGAWIDAEDAANVDGVQHLAGRVAHAGARRQPEEPGELRRRLRVVARTRSVQVEARFAVPLRRSTSASHASSTEVGMPAG